MPAIARRLASRLLLLTVMFVMVAEVLIFLPSVANFRIGWLKERLDAAAVASILITQSSSEDLPPDMRRDVLMATGAKAIALREAESSRILVMSDMPVTVDKHVDVTEVRPTIAIVDAFDTLLFGGDRVIRVFGPAGDTGKRIEVIMPDAPLRAAMLVYARNVALLSLLISLFTAALVFVAINSMMIRPVRRMTRAMLRFAMAPDDPGAIIQPSTRSDEIGIAERELNTMQRQLHETLRNQKHLADLGLAVSKINHDMRNLLASAQLMSDRLSTVSDPAVQRFAPKLVRTIDRAVAYSENVLAYGRAREDEPKRRRAPLHPLLGDVVDLLGLERHEGMEIVNTVPAELEIDADPEQLFRVLTNLGRNAVQAMVNDDRQGATKRLSFAAARMGATVIVSVRDSGPGLPPKARENLFSAFKGSARSGGTGLGLAIAHELVRAHGGTLELRDDGGDGACFEIRIPDAPVPLNAVRADRGGRKAAVVSREG
ncbi:MAG TPA: HAMP domain-containing sensor histidine kinase [Rhizobiaceae bacterium]|nr:HAMP domain-containing sensor histidine kinase [Rhizobiaceae bacterium]